MPLTTGSPMKRTSLLAPIARSFASLAVAMLSVSGCVATGAMTSTGGQSPEHMARAQQVLSESPLIDGHNDLPWAIRQSRSAPHDVEAYDLRQRVSGHTDLARLKTGQLGGQFWSVYVPGDTTTARLGFAKVQLEQMDIARRVIAKYPETFEATTTANGFRLAFARGRIGSVLGMEGGHVIENSLGALRAFYDLGARYMTLTHNQHLDWADAAAGVPRHGGLTPFGREVVREMNRLGMLVDLSHVSPATMSHAMDVSEAPIIFSHSNARAIHDHVRNVPDSILARMPKNGGVVMVTFVPGFIGAQPTVGRVADHIEHIRKVAGVDHVGIGGDFDGIDVVIPGLEDVSKYPNLFAELARRGWSDDDLRKLAGENILRAFEAAERVAARLQRERPASTKTIGQLDR